MYSIAKGIREAVNNRYEMDMQFGKLGTLKSKKSLSAFGEFLQLIIQQTNFKKLDFIRHPDYARIILSSGT